jgi:hypothetical protein
MAQLMLSCDGSVVSTLSGEPRVDNNTWQVASSSHRQRHSRARASRLLHLEAQFDVPHKSLKPKLSVHQFKLAQSLILHFQIVNVHVIVCAISE